MPAPARPARPEDPLARAGVSIAALLIAASAPLAGCAGPPPDTGPRLVQLEVALAALERRVDGVAGLERRLTALETALALPSPAEAEERQRRLVLIEGRALDHDQRLKALGERLDALETHVQGGEGGRRPLVTIEGGPDAGLRRRPLPAAGAALQVLSVGSGGLLLIKGPQGLVRVELVGVDPPRRAEEYAQDPALAARHRAALGRPLTDDAAWERSLVFLERLLAGREVTLDYPPGAVERPGGGTLRAYVRLTDPAEGEEADVNARVIAAGYALPAPGHPRADAYAAHAAEARAAGAGLFAPSSAD